ASAEHVARPHQHRQSNLARKARRLFRHKRSTVPWLGNAQLVEQSAESPSVFSKINRFRSGTDDGHTVALQFQREIQRRLSAKLHDYAIRFFALDDGKDVLERQRFEIETIRSVVIRRNRF